MRLRRLDKDGESAWGHGASDWLLDADAVAQLCYTRMKLNLGEWFLDAALGAAWLGQPDSQGQILGRHGALAFAESEMKRVVLETPGVSAINSFAFNFNRQTRAASVTVEISTIYGAPRTVVARTDT